MGLFLLPSLLHWLKGIDNHRIWSTFIVAIWMTIFSFFATDWLLASTVCMNRSVSYSNLVPMSEETLHWQDSGGEYMLNESEKFLKKDGIQHEETIPTCPEQNGVKKRLNRVIMETARCMLAEAKLPHKLWAEGQIQRSWVWTLIRSNLDSHTLSKSDWNQTYINFI